MTEYKQYEFEITRRDSGKRDQIRATAASPTQARQAIIKWLGSHWAVALTPIATRKAHQVVGEIDCT